MNEASTEADGRPARRPALALLRATLVLLVAWYVLRSLAREVAALESAGVPEVPLPWILGAGVTAFAGMAVTLLQWKAYLRALGHPLRLVPVWRILSCSLLGRYVPGRVWGMVAATYRMTSWGLGKGEAVYLQALVILSTTTASLALGLAALVQPEVARHGVGAPLGLAAGLAILGAVVLLSGTPPFRWILSLVLHRIDRSGAPYRPVTLPASCTMAATAAAVVAVSLLGLSFHLVLAALAVGLGGHAPAPLASIGVSALAWLVGFYSFLVPAGLGVREGTMILVAPWAGLEGPVALAALCSRVVYTLTEVLFALSPFLARSPTPGPPEAGPDAPVPGEGAPGAS